MAIRPLSAGKRKKPCFPARPAVLDPAAANPLHSYRRAFLAWAQAAGYSAATTHTRDAVIARFIGWCDERGLVRPTDITRTLLERYQRHLYLHRKADGVPLSLKTQEGLLNPLRAWFKWLVRQNHILHNPAADLVLPRIPRQLPKVLLSVVEVEEVLNQPDVTAADGLRDRAILETFYSSGIRRMELARLSLYDADLAQGTLMIRQGKGRRDRLIPLADLHFNATTSSTRKPSTTARAIINLSTNMIPPAPQKGSITATMADRAPSVKAETLPP
jgi:integrase/recombinase XerD